MAASSSVAKRPRRRSGSDNLYNTTGNQSGLQDQPLLKRRRHHSAPPILEPSNIFEVVASDARREIVLLLLQQAENLWARAAAETAQLKEADELLIEAKNLEVTLRQKKKHLLAELDKIAGRLKGIL